MEKNRERKYRRCAGDRLNARRRGNEWPDGWRSGGGVCVCVCKGGVGCRGHML